MCSRENILTSTLLGNRLRFWLHGRGNFTRLCWSSKNRQLLFIDIATGKLISQQLRTMYEYPFILTDYENKQKVSVYKENDVNARLKPHKQISIFEYYWKTLHGRLWIRIQFEVGRTKENERKWVLTTNANSKSENVWASNHSVKCPIPSVRGERKKEKR